ncbi:MAG: pseudaminic acid cytidylyltransferase [Burkholderiales bacterium]|nr:pseudaminic acid cytidylyltransferase [Burkholderiales bacterium]
MSRIAIIPARGGSKRIPRKNLRPFHGKPIIAYSIDVARRSRLFDRIVVSTDDDEIADLAVSLGADVPFRRPDELANDFATTLAVIQHAINSVAEQGTKADYVCCLYATAPMLAAESLQEAAAQLEQRPDKSYVFSVTHFDFPVQRALKLGADGAVDALYPQYRDTRSQDLEPAFHDAGQFYIGRTAAWLRGDPIMSPCSLPYKLPRHRVQDIDTPDDWRRAELLYAALQQLGEIA